MPLLVYAPLSYSEVREVRSPLGNTNVAALREATGRRQLCILCGDVVVVLLGLLMQIPCVGVLAGHADMDGLDLGIHANIVKTRELFKNSQIIF
jgi:hypothetical protein